MCHPYTIDELLTANMTLRNMYHEEHNARVTAEATVTHLRHNLAERTHCRGGGWLSRAWHSVAGYRVKGDDYPRPDADGAL